MCTRAYVKVHGYARDRECVDAQAPDVYAQDTAPYPDQFNTFIHMLVDMHWRTNFGMDQLS